jgi:SAM-dependent methyltransferase
MKKRLMRWCAKIILIWMQKLQRLLNTVSTKAEGGLHPKHRLMDYHRFFMEQVAVQDRVIDIGCGVGAVSIDLAASAKFVVGVDFNIKSLFLAKEGIRKNGVANAAFCLSDANRSCFKNQFDKIVLSNVLEHIDDRVGLLRSLKALAPILLLRVPMVDRDWLTLYRRDLGLDYMLDTTHRIEYTADILTDELQAGGWVITSSCVKFGETWAVCKTRENS